MRGGVGGRRAWTISPDDFRGYVGTFSPLSVVREHVEGVHAESLRRSGELHVSVGEHRRCVAPPEPVPDPLKSLRQVSVQPTEESITTCLVWFSVDLFVNPDGDIEAVTLDLFEP